MNIKKIILSNVEKLLLEFVDNQLFGYIEEYAAKTENKVDDTIVDFVKSFKQTLLEQIDKIDGEKDLDA